MTFVLFGAMGDLAKRKIFPALYNLFLNQKMPNSFSIISTDINKISNDEFQSYVKESLNTFSRGSIDEYSKIEEFIRAFRYHALDANNQEGYRELLTIIQKREKELNIPENRLFYLSVAPQLFDLIGLNIKESGLSYTKGWKRLVIEKPFGYDLKSAQELNKKLNHTFKEDEIYRIDHYLGKPMIQNLETLKSANPVLQALWNNQYIANVQITASETVGVEERAGYYDQAGAIRDMFQNHMLQMLMMMAMYLPIRSSTEGLRNKKKKVMESLRTLQKEEIDTHIVRGQYEPGEIMNESVVGYKGEPGVPPSSTIDTFIAARLWIDNDRWNGVPFYIRTGKRMKEKSTRIVIEFKHSLKEMYMSRNEETAPNLLIIEISPNSGVSFQLNSKNPLHEGQTEPVYAGFLANQERVPEAYEQLIYDALSGDSTFFAHWNEVELSWNWMQTVLDAFEENILPLHPYRSGSMGPEASDRLLKEDGFKWWEIEYTQFINEDIARRHLI
jgi:glucose-6-phosphate 1-dehydrogenase